MNENEFRSLLFNEFSMQEMALINPNIYLNPDHVDYYINAHNGEYDKCIEFLRSNRHLLTLEHTPEKFKEFAESQIESAKQFTKEQQ